MSEIIEHKGRVVSVDAACGTVTVEIVSESACAACRAKSMCSMSETENKRIEVAAGKQASLYREGDRVMVSVTRGMGIRAVLFAYVFPFFVLMAVLIGCTAAGVAETWAGVASLAAAALYYAVLSLMKAKFGKQIIFNITKI
ncbi:MAG: SoxR reducing system RseC family protein [Rikenellaceae bacterium]|nr:SoxR reducing system RseC family protein [Rikenellaceae bacterium]